MPTGWRSVADQKLLAVSCGGTHEVMIFRTDRKRLPWRAGSSRDLIAPELLKKDGRYRRVEVGGRPTELAFAPDSKTLYVANYLGDAVDVVDADSAKLIRTIHLGGPKTPSLARRGEILFHDARTFLQPVVQLQHLPQRWTHQRTGLRHAQRRPAGSEHFPLRSRKKVPTLRRVTQTRPWTWHGWQTSLDDAMVESFTKSMQGTQALGGGRQGTGGVPGHARLSQESLPAAGRQTHSGRSAR